MRLKYSCRELFFFIYFIKKNKIKIFSPALHKVTAKANWDYEAAPAAGMPTAFKKSFSPAEGMRRRPQ
jgi:hypothetical protein